MIGRKTRTCHSVEAHETFFVGWCWCGCLSRARVGHCSTLEATVVTKFFKRLESVRIEKCQNAFFFKIGKCQNAFFFKIEMCQNAFFFKIGKCQNLKVSESESVRIWNCQNLKVSELESVRIGKCQNWKVSESESVRIGKCQNYLKFRDSL